MYCRVCGKAQMNTPWVLRKNKPYGTRCKACHAAACKKYYAESPDYKNRLLESTKRQRLLKKRKLLDTQAARNWQIQNPEKHAELCLKRRTAERQANPIWLSKADKQIIAHFYKIAAMLTKTTGTVYHVDHVIPLRGKNVCGLHIPANLQILSAAENFSKGNKYVGSLGL